ncbi:hypothetical protein NKG05_17335 [Oerskovia sp. M15]
MVDVTGRPPERPEGQGGGDDPRDLLAAYALDAVDDLDRRVVERLLAVDPDARRELDEHRAVVAAFTVETAPPPGLRDEVLGRIASVPQVVVPDGVSGAVGSARAAARHVGPAAGSSSRLRRPPRWRSPSRRRSPSRPGRSRSGSRRRRTPSRRCSPTRPRRSSVARWPGRRRERAGVGRPGALLGHGPAPGRVRRGLPALARRGRADGLGRRLRRSGRFSGAARRGRRQCGVAVTLEPAGGSPAPTSDPLLVLET